MQSHLMSQPLRAGSGSYAYWAITPQQRVIVFVHGFNGHPLTTWQHFDTLLLLDPGCGGTDFIFYGYDSTKTRAMISAVQFYEFLDEMLSTPGSVFQRSAVHAPARHSQFSYQKATVVAHSLGSLVSRQALLEATREGKSWANRVQSILFAPAHMGADIVRLVGACFFNIPFMGVPVGILRYYFSVLHDLEVGSPFLNDLLRETWLALQTGRCSYLDSKKVLFGDREKIVSPNRFANDPTPIIISGRGHIDVCKPNGSFLNPYNEVVSAL